MIVQVTIRGLTPLLMNRMDPSVLEALRTKTKKAKTASIGSTLTPHEEAERKLYLAEDGPYIPGRMLMSCLIEAGKYVRLDGKRQITNAKTTVLPGLMALLSSTIPLREPDTDKPAEWEADVMQGRNPNGGEAVALCRPRFDAWSMTFLIEIYEDEIGENTIRELMDKAGRRCGLADYRPQRKGIFGQFLVERWDRLNS